jgi:hypothetical protein
LNTIGKLSNSKKNYTKNKKEGLQIGALFFV